MEDRKTNRWLNISMALNNLPVKEIRKQTFIRDIIQRQELYIFICFKKLHCFQINMVYLNVLKLL